MKRPMLIVIGSLLFPHFAWADASKVYEKLETLSKVLSYVEANYIEEVKPEEILDNAIKGLVANLDPHTAYMPPENFREMRVDTKGEFGGLGIEITMKDDQLTVITPIDDTPADRAGVKAGDKIKKIDGASTKGMSLLDAIKKLRGPRGSTCTLTLDRQGTKDSFDVILRRETIRLASVASELIENQYGYLRIKSFQERTGRELEKQLAELDKKAGKDGVKGILLDLRNNPGGLLDQAIRVADLFVESGVIVSTIGRKGSFQEVEIAHKEGTHKTVPTIVLVNEGTASASEIVAGALQDHGKAVILGTQTFGKGSVQTIIDLGDGSGLKLTIARYYTPKGRSIQALGIAPDIVVSDVPPPAPSDENYLREKDLKGHIEAQTPEANMPPKPEAKSKTKIGMINFDTDIQAKRALEYIKTWEVFGSLAKAQVSTR